MNSSVFVSVIDSLFDRVIHLSSRGISLLYESFVFPVSSQGVHEEGPVSLEHAASHTFKSIRDVLHVERSSDAVLLHEMTYYASAIPVSIYENPTIEFDTQIGRIPYGESLHVYEARGRFFRIMWNGITGWVLRDDCVDRASLVYPEFKSDEAYGVDHPHTAHVRAIIKDEFGVGRSEFPLQAGEYVLYKLWRKGIKIVWPTTGHRVPGVWHTILKGSTGVHMGVMPKTGAIMEYMINTDVGHVAYVEAVFPDGTMSISEVNFPDSGIYSERTLTKDEWKILRPVFIQIV